MYSHACCNFQTSASFIVDLESHLWMFRFQNCPSGTFLCMPLVGAAAFSLWCCLLRIPNYILATPLNVVIEYQQWKCNVIMDIQCISDFDKEQNHSFDLEPGPLTCPWNTIRSYLQYLMVIELDAAYNVNVQIHGRTARTARQLSCYLSLSTIVVKE